MSSGESATELTGTTGGTGAESDDSAGSAGGTGTASTTSTSGSSTESSGETGTSTSTGHGSTSATTSTTDGATGSTTGECDVPCEGGGSCVDGRPPVAKSCVDGCEVAIACGVATSCEVRGDVASCVEADECSMIDAAYVDLVTDPKSLSCGDDNDCQTLSGACELPSGQCWEVLNTSVSQEQLDLSSQSWMDANCGGECACEGRGPIASCVDGVCEPA